MLNEFKEFIAKGSVMDPAVGLVLGGADFTNLFVLLKDGVKAPPPYETLVQAKAAGAVVFGYGAFVTQVVQFLILAWIVFMMVKAVNRMRRTA